MWNRSGTWQSVARIQLLALCLLLTGLGCVMMSKMSWRSTTNPHAGSPESIATGSEIYARDCASCHGAAGFGDGEDGKRLAKPPTNLRVFIGERSDGYFASQVAHGKTGNAEMPIFDTKLSRDEIWHVTNFVFSLGAVASAPSDPESGSSR